MSKPFSAQLEQWLKSSKPKTLETLLDAFGEKSFAIVVLVLMFFPALPIPTGGITHLFELVVMLVSLEMIFGRRTLWLPQKLLKRSLGEKLTGKAVPFIIKEVKWFEKYSKPRYGNLINQRLTYAFTGVLFFALAVAAAVAPPFTGLDTVPALAAVMISLALILDDAYIFIVGTVLSLAGIALIIFTGQATFHFIKHLF